MINTLKSSVRSFGDRVVPVMSCLKCAMPIVVILAFIVEVSSPHVQVKGKNAMVVTFIAGSLRFFFQEEGGGDGTPHVGEVQVRLQKVSQLFGPSYANIAISPNSAC
jgi:hypothetical protein